MKFIKKNIKLVGLIGFLLIYLFYLLPTAKGYLGKIFVPVKIPQEFYSVNQWLKKQNNNFKVIWLPIYQGQSTLWAKDKAIGDFPTFSSFSPSFYVLASPYLKTYLEWLTTPVVKTDTLGKYFSFLATRFLIFHDDLPTGHPKLTELEAQKDLSKVFGEGLIKIFENKKAPPRLYALNSLYLVAGGFDSLKNLVEFDQFDPTKNGLIFTDRQIGLDERLLTLVKGIVLEREEELELLPLFAEPHFFIFPAENLKSHNPSKAWSVGGLTEPLHAPWASYLEEKELRKHWQFDYNKNFIFTWATKILPKKINQKKAIPLQLSGFKSLSPQLILNGNQATIKQGRSGIWRVVTSAQIKVSENTGYTLKLDLTAFKVNQLHPKIYFFDKNERILQADFVFGGTDGNFRKKVSYNFVTPFETEALELQLWALENPQTTSRFIIKKVILYERSVEAKANSFSIPFEVKEEPASQNEKEFAILARVFRNQKGGQISLTIDNQLLPTLETQSSENSFQWLKVGRLNLSGGTHTLTITNLKGLNGVSTVAVLPTAYLELKENQIKNFLKERKIIYTFPPGLEENNLNLKKSTPYFLAVKLPQTDELKPYALMINNQNLTFNSGLTETVSLASVNLVEGQNKIRLIKPIKIIANLETSWSSNLPDLLFSKDPSSKTQAKILASPDNKLWRVGSTDFLPIVGGSSYSLDWKLTAQNANQLHAKISYYDASRQALKTDFVFGGIDGNFQEREFNYKFLAPAETHFLKLQIWAKAPTKGETFFQIENLNLGDSPPDPRAILLWPASLGNLGQLFQTSNPPPQVNFSETASSKFIVNVSQTNSPFILALTESYNPLWQARLDKRETGVSEVAHTSFPLYSMLNGFYFDKAPKEPVILEFGLQKYFAVGAVLTLLALIGGVLLAYKKRKG